MIKTVMIDVDDTLIDFPKSRYVSIKNLFDEQSLNFSEKVLDVYTEVCTPLWAAAERGEITGEDIRRVRWGIILEKLGIKIEDGIDFEAEFRKHLSKTHFLIDGAKELLEYLSKKYTVCIASNSYYQQQYDRLVGSGLMPYIDHIFVSNEIGHEKPSKQFFEHCLKQSGSLASESIMIGDSVAADVKGAENSGMKSIWFNKNKKSREGVTADYIVESLLEIKDIL